MFSEEVACCSVDSTWFFVSEVKLDRCWSSTDVKGFKDVEDSEVEAVMMELWLTIEIVFCVVY